MLCGRACHEVLLFQHVISNHLLIGYHYRIACARQNAFHKPVRQDKPEDEQIANYILQRAQDGNSLKNQIEALGLELAEARGRWSGWLKYASDTVPSFPTLTLEDLQQDLIQAASYTKFHLQHNDKAYNIRLNRVLQRSASSWPSLTSQNRCVLSSLDRVRPRYSIKKAMIRFF